MDSVNEYRQSLQRLQDAWDQLTLLGQMSGIAADITATAREFRALTASLLQSLAGRLSDHSAHALRGKAQVTIDILVRNLFERTADVGFLATDKPVRDFLLSGGEDASQRAELEARFRAYVAKYSVYDDVLVLDTQGRVRARLDQSVQADQCHHDTWRQAMRGGQAYVEQFGQFDVLGGRRALVYAAPIRQDKGTPLGVLYLSFRLDDEMRGVFAKLTGNAPQHVLTLLSAQGEVVASSDAWQVPVGAPLALDMQASGAQRVLFAGRPYLAVVARTNGYQGYGGPGWTGCALVPLNQAFNRVDEAGDAGQASEARQVDLPLIEGSALFDETLRRIPGQARHIQIGLERSVWNGELHGRRALNATASETRFAAALLHQVSVTGERIRHVFDQAIADLQSSTAASVLHEASFRSALAIDIMDRNLYERANDCRWWALDGSLRQALIDPSPESQRKAGAVLAHINSLYTVYSLLLLLDEQGRIVASSSPTSAHLHGQRLNDDWVRQALSLHDEQSHARSAFQASDLYEAQPTYVYAASVCERTGRTAGATAIVFDSRPQFEAMLRDALPQADAQPGQRQAPPAHMGLYVSRDGLIVGSSDSRHVPGQKLPFHAQLPSLARGESHQQFLVLDGDLYALGMTMSGGYREYNSAGTSDGADVAAIVLIYLGRQATSQPDPARAPANRLDHPPAQRAWQVHAGQPLMGVAGFLCSGQWLGLQAHHVLEALDSPRLTTLPGSHAHTAGVILHEGRMVPVLDLAALRGRPTQATATATAAAGHTERIVLICRTSEDQLLGLLVDQLAGVFDVPLSALQSLDDQLHHLDPLAQAIVYADQAAQADMLTVLNLDAIAATLWGQAATPGSRPPLADRKSHGQPRDCSVAAVPI